MHWQVFIPESESAPQGAQPGVVLPTVGLGAFLEGAEAFPCPSGPDGRSGNVVAWRDPSKGAAGMQMGFRPDEQTAIDAIGFGGEPDRYTILLWNDRLPKPGELERRSPLYGKPFDLGDGHQWAFPSPLELPADIQHNRAGKPLYLQKPEFHAFTRLADDIVERIERQETETITDGDIVACLIEALAINYRLTIEVADALRLFSTSNIGGPLEHVTAFDRFAEAG